MSANGIITAFGQRMEEPMEIEEPTTARVCPKANIDGSECPRELVVSNPHNEPTSLCYRCNKLYYATSEEPTPTPHVPTADQPLFAELMRLEAAIVDALREEMDAGQHYQQCNRALGQAQVLEHDADERLVCARTRVAQLGEEIVRLRAQMVSARLATGDGGGA